MNAGQVIQLFVDQSGLYAFVDDEGVPSAQAWTLLNSAQKFLDRELGHPKENAWLLKEVAAGEKLISFQQARYVKGVYHNTTALKWTPAYHDVETEEEHWPLQAIELESSSNVARTIRILAAWKSPVLAESEDVSFWTVQHEDILVQAMVYQFERTLGNAQRVNDQYQQIQHDCRMIYNDMIMEQMAGPSEDWRLD